MVRSRFRCRGLAPVLLASLVVAAVPPPPDTGKVAYAYPVSNLTIDGDLSDWPAHFPRYAIDRYSFGSPANPADFRASFRAGYSVDTQSIYVGLEVVDEAHTVDATSEVSWQLQDGHTVYVDATHSPRGSGARLYTAIGDQVRLIGLSRSWDPDVGLAKKKDVEVVVRRLANKTIYEWRIHLGDQLRPGRSVGFDHLVSDWDPGDREDAQTLATWGRNSGKSRGASRCADLVLLDPAQPMGVLKGTVGWQRPSEAPCPKRVRVTSTGRPDLWVHVNADDEGRYEVLLPAGDYTVSSPFKAIDYRNSILSLDETVRVQASVRSTAIRAAPPLQLVVRKLPSIDRQRGALFDFDAETAKEIDAFVAKAMDYYRVPGVSLALIKGAKLVHHRVYGVKNFYTAEPVTKDTLFEAASITKTVFAFAVNRLAERGKIDLDKPLHEYLPWPAIAHDERYKSITARHCLAHRTGFPNWAYMNDDGKIDIKFAPGTKYGYSGEGTQYLGRVVAHIMGKPLEAVIREETLVPMGLTSHVFFKDEPELRKVVSHGHYSTRTTASYIPQEIGVAHSMHTEAGVFSNFVVGLLRKQGLTAASYEKMFGWETKIPLAPDHTGLPWPRGFGLGFQVMKSPFGPVFGHGGSNGDFMCRFEAYPDQQIGFVVFTNNSEGTLLWQDLRQFLILGKRKVAGPAEASAEKDVPRRKVP